MKIEQNKIIKELLSYHYCRRNITLTRTYCYCEEIRKKREIENRLLFKFTSATSQKR